MRKNRSPGTFPAFAGLVKLKLSLAVGLSSVTGYFLSTNIPGRELIFLASGIFFLASGSAALNQFTERYADAIMERTKNRPIPSGMISEKQALAFSVFLLLAGALLLNFNGKIPLLLGIINVLLYNVIYTRLKKVTILAIIPGAMVGAVPPMIGYASAGGSVLDNRILAFSVFMFLWQLPHFWLIIIKYGKEYSSAGFPTIIKYMSELQIRHLVFSWVIFSTIFLSFFFILNESLDKKMFIALSLLNCIFIAVFYRSLFSHRASREIKSAFILLNSFSFLIMLILITMSILKVIWYK